MGDAFITGCATILSFEKTREDKSDIMTFDELIRNRRSIRKFTDTPVSMEMVHELIQQSTFAPNAGNEQPWKFIVVNSKRMINKISDECKKNILARIGANPDDYAKKYQGMLKNESFNVFYNAPCLVMILGFSELKNLFVDCAMAGGYLMMAAVNSGLGTCWVNFGTEIHDPAMKYALGIPDNCKIVAPIILGYPEAIPAIPKRKDPEVLKIIT